MDQSSYSTTDSADITNESPSQNKGSLSSFAVRAASGLIYAGLFIGCLYFGTIPTTIFVSAMSWLCCFEFFRMMRLDGKVANEFIGLTASILFPVASMFGSLWVTVLLPYSFLRSVFGTSILRVHEFRTLQLLPLDPSIPAS